MIYRMILWRLLPSLLQGFFEEGGHARPGVSGGRGAVAVFVVGIFKGVARTVIDFYVAALARGFHGGIEGLHRRGGDAAVVSAKIAQYRRFDFADVRRIGGQWSVIDNAGGEFRFIHGKADGVATAHAPSHVGDFGWIDVGARGEVSESSFQIALRAVFRDAAHDFMSFVGRGSHFAAV